VKVDFAFLCDYADISGPKITARGIGFDEIYAPSEPWTAPEFWYVAQLSAGMDEVGEKDLHIELIGADGNVVAELDGTFAVVRPTPGEDTKARIAVAFNDVSFPRYGDYSLHFVADGHEVHATSLFVSELTAAE
jgi:hypothetical protein